MGREGIRGEDKVPMALHLWLTSISATDHNSIKKTFIHFTALSLSLSLSLSLLILGAGGRCPGRGGGCTLFGVIGSLY
jgi:hypothetical protein